MKQNSSGANVLVIILMILVVVLAAAVVFLWLRQNDNEAEPRVIASFQDCADAGYPVAESNPRTCRVGDVTFTEESTTNGTEEPTGLIEHSSPKGAVVKLQDISDNELVTSPLRLSGEVRGSWSFEANFPVRLESASGETLAQGAATLEGDWMTDDYVPFNVTLSYEVPAGTETGNLILEKSNPSGLDENADSVSVPVRFQE